MGIDQGRILNATVMHARLIPRRNSFRYGIYYIALPLAKLGTCAIAQEKFGLTSFYNKDHGPCDGAPLLQWALNILENHEITEADGEIVLLCMPRVLGYVFNPVSFWICHDKSQNIRAIICEVHNTFGERHSYICAREDRKPITGEDRLVAHKMFHVSPFLEREGHYEFAFNVSVDKFSVKIDYFDGAGQKTLLTSLAGDFIPLSPSALRQSFWKHPLVTFKAIVMIHWQALKIFSKSIKYISKPPQKHEKISGTRNITKI